MSRRTRFAVAFGVALSLSCGVALAQAERELDGPDSTDEPSSDESTPEKGNDFSGYSESTDSTDRVRLSDRAELDRVVGLYMAGSYEQCSEELGRFLDPKGAEPFVDPGVIEQGRLYFASCAILEGNREEARKVLRDALEENPLMPSPDSLTFPPPLVSLFLEVRDEVKELIAASEKEQVVRLRRENELARRRAEQREFRERELEKLARQESLITKNSRFLAAIPFGVGQYQNGNKPLGALFLVSEGLLLGTAVTSGLILESLTSSAAAEDFELTEDGVRIYNKQTGAAYKALTWSSWGLVGVAALGIAEAQFNFKKERRMGSRRRSLPPELEAPIEEPQEGSFEVRPIFGVLPGGGHLGVVGRF